MELRELKSEDRISYTKLLLQSGLRADIPGHSLGLFEEGELIGAGGYDGSTLKGFAIRDEYRGEGLLGKLVAPILDEIKGQAFVYTKPSYAALFQSLGFYLLAKTSSSCFLTYPKSSYLRWIDNLKSYKAKAIIVANANPFTLGHLHLVKQALKDYSKVLVLIVEADESSYPFFLRFQMAKRALKDEKGAVVLPSGPFIISKSTFPTYFIKDSSKESEIYADLDAEIFCKIAKDADLEVRYVGSEPDDPLTSYYNQALSSRTRVEIIPRLENISASTFRKTQDINLVPKENISLLELVKRGNSKEEILSSLAKDALVEEVLLTPKPGLVDQNNNGSHKDMDLNLFLKSAQALESYFKECVKLGENYNGDFDPLLRQAGIKAEASMLEATNNVNTHKGAIFSMGIMLYCLSQDPFADPKDKIIRLCQSLVAKKGATDQARSGYSLVFEALSYTPPRALLFFMSKLEDTNILRRGGQDSLLFVQNQARSLLEIEDDKLEQALLDFDKQMIERNLSPGASADLLELYFLFKLFWPGPKNNLPNHN